MKKTIALILVLVAGFAGGYGYGRWYGPKPAVHAEKPVSGYHCPMHPHIKSDHPGDCPVCGMRMVPDASPAAAAEASNIVMIPAEKQQWIGLKTGTAEFHSGTGTIRATARVVVDETRVFKVQSRTEGWIEKVYADFTGRLVKKGEPLVSLYSPELMASQQEYLLARQAHDTMSHSVLSGVSHYNESMERVARTRLEHHWGMDPAAIAELERTGQPRKSITIVAPETAFITARNVYASQMVKPEMELYTLADLSHVWIIADIFESDAQNVRLGQWAMIEPAYAAGRKFRARVTNILPQVDAQTRTLKVRLEADNPDFVLKPDLFVNAEFAYAATQRLTVPQDAVIDTGNTRVVYVDLGEGRFEPRRVEAGERFDGRIEILSGLSEGERIVINGAFLVDSESRMRSNSK